MKIWRDAYKQETGNDPIEVAAKKKKSKEAKAERENISAKKKETEEICSDLILWRVKNDFKKVGHQSNKWRIVVCKSNTEEEYTNVELVSAIISFHYKGWDGLKNKLGIPESE